MNEHYILIVDDEVVLCELIEQILKSEGFCVKAAHSGQAALKLIKAYQFDLVITDINMPDISGIDILREVKTVNANTSVIIMTGFASIGSAKDAMRLGAYDYLTKPFETNEIIFSVNRAIESQKLLLANKKLSEEVHKLSLDLKGDDLKNERVFTLEHRLTSFIALDTINSIICELLVDIFIPNFVIAYLMDKNGRLKLMHTCSIDKEIVNSEICRGEGISGLAAETRSIIVTEAIDVDGRFSDRKVEQYLDSAVASIPIIFENNVVAVFTMQRQKGNTFSPSEINIMAKIAEQSVNALKNAMQYKELEDNYFNTFSRLVEIIEERYSFIIGHSKNVATYAYVLAEQIGLSQEEQATITKAGLLHDIGKIKVSDEIITKPSSLNNSEWEFIKGHVIIGKDILEPMKFLEDILPIIIHHHERYDGMGYPDGLKGEHIPLGSRILAIADSYDAMASNRPYRAKLTKEDIIKEFEDGANSQYDPELVSVFLEILKKRPQLLKAS